MQVERVKGRAAEEPTKERHDPSLDTRSACFRKEVFYRDFFTNERKVENWLTLALTRDSKPECQHSFFPKVIPLSVTPKKRDVIHSDSIYLYVIESKAKMNPLVRWESC